MTWQIITDGPVPAVWTQAALPAPVLHDVDHQRAGDIVVATHNYANWRKMRARGLLVPSPIAHYRYPLRPGIAGPKAAQKKAIDFMLEYDRGCVLLPMRCVDADTEFLSPRGWVRIADWSGQQVAQYHPTSKEMTFVAPDGYIKAPCDKMIRVKNRSLDQMLSAEHRMLVVDREGKKTEIVEAQEMLRRQDAYLAGARNEKHRDKIGYTSARVPTTFGYAGGPGMCLSDAEIRLQIAVIADGHFPDNSKLRVLIRLKKARKIVRLKRLLAEAGVEYQERIITEDDQRSDTGFHLFRFEAPRRQKEFSGDWWDCTADQLAVVRDEVLHWDGSAAVGARMGSFCSVSAASVDFVQFAFVAGGVTARLHEDKREYVTGVCRSVQLQEGHPIGLHGVKSDGTPLRPMRWEPTPDGFKYCFSVPTGFLVLRHNGCVFITGNSGKTSSAAWVVDYLRKESVIRRALIVAPKSVCYHVWEREFFFMFPHLRAKFVTGTAKQKQKAALDLRNQILIVNYESLHIIADYLPHVDAIVADEATKVKSVKTRTWKAMDEVSRNKRLWLLTAGPTPQSPMDAYGLLRLIRPKYMSMSAWREMTMYAVGKFRWLPKDDADRTVATWLQPAVRVSREECVDLSGVQIIERGFDLTPEQVSLCEKFRDEAAAELRGVQITAANAAVVLAKQMQVQSGGIIGYDAGGERQAYTIEAEPFFSAIEELVAESDTPCLVFTPFRASVKAIAEALQKEGHSVGVITGETPAAERSKLFDAVQNKSLKALVAIPTTMSHGITLFEAHTVIWAAPPTSNEQYQQANGRVTNPNGRTDVGIYQMVGSPLARRMFKRLETAEALQDAVLALLS